MKPWLIDSSRQPGWDQAAESTSNLARVSAQSSVR